MRLEKIPGTGTQGDSLPLALSKTGDSNMFFRAQSPLNCEERRVSPHAGRSGEHSLMKGQHRQVLHKREFILMITAERSSRPPKDRWIHEQKLSGNGPLVTLEQKEREYFIIVTWSGFKP